MNSSAAINLIYFVYDASHELLVRYRGGVEIIGDSPDGRIGILVQYAFCAGYMKVICSKRYLIWSLGMGARCGRLYCYYCRLRYVIWSALIQNALSYGKEWKEETNPLSGRHLTVSVGALLESCPRRSLSAYDGSLHQECGNRAH